ncbi:LLM class flavin-dependent oxidoreductase [Actinomycetospora termitidis]|uniref:LLM class flavin-dependent oxidoreductase n=1 Tax=Actinomycetospora termitidis TaxID=3053470 RepID=A0ABT7MEM9_9PSEU|nr:LLM class flavin-dependent oxidoreductase [Actinomycetospora sp. Odt1-22]MDL5159120.1 LLM class flavin-dependent oxidoreductase [Actinomycetospora sp. Odt1-22]
MGDVRVGVFLTHQRRPEQDPRTVLAEQLALVRTARDEGLDSVFAGQHHLAASFAHIQPLPWLARVAAEAGEMTVGTGIHLLALHHPVDTAETYASLDVVCGGRSVFGVGLGYRAEEYAAFGVPPEDKVRRFTENLAIVRALWRGEAVTRDLPWTRLDGAEALMRPVGEPPVWMAANSDAAVRRAARLADAWMINPHATASTVRRQLELYDAERSAHGLPPGGERPIMREVFCADTREEALERARPFLEGKYQVYADWGQDRVMPDRESFRMEFSALADDRFVIGDPDDCRRALLAWCDLGVDHFVLRTDWAGMPLASSRRSVELLAREVAPALRESSLSTAG